MKKASSIQDIVKFNKEQLNQENIDNLYVPPMSNNTTEEICQFLNFAYDIPQKLIIAGPKGAGKNTLLYYLSQIKLDKFQIISVNLIELLDPMDIKPVDFIFCLLHHLIQELSKSQKRLDPFLINTLYQNLHDEKLMDLIKFKKSEAGDEEGTKIGFVKSMIIAVIDTLPITDKELRIEVRKSLESCLRLIMKSIQGIIDYMNSNLKQRDKKLLIIFYDLDKFSPSTIEPFFKEYFHLIERLHVHIIYTMPDFIRFSDFFDMLSQRIDKIIFKRPVSVLNPDKSSSQEGMSYIKNIITKYIDHQLIPESMYDKLIINSGGILNYVFELLIDTALYTLIIDPTSKVLLPEAFEQSQKFFSRYLIQQMNHEQAELIKNLNLSQPSWYGDKNIKHLISRNILIEYESGEHIWFAVHPLLQKNF